MKSSLNGLTGLKTHPDSTTLPTNFPLHQFSSRAVLYQRQRTKSPFTAIRMVTVVLEYFKCHFWSGYGPEFSKLGATYAVIVILEMSYGYLQNHELVDKSGLDEPD